MKKIVALTILAALLASGSAQAQLTPDTGALVGFHAGYAVTKIKEYDETYPGWGLGLTVDRMVSTKISVGATLSYIGGNKDVTQGDLKISSSYSALPMSITGKFYFGSEKITGYLGVGAGIHIGSLKNEIDDTSTGEFERRDQDVTSFSMAVPLGVYILVGNQTYLNLGYLPSFVVDNEMVDGATHYFILGVVGTM